MRDRRACVLFNQHPLQTELDLIVEPVTGAGFLVFDWARYPFLLFNQIEIAGDTKGIRGEILPTRDLHTAFFAVFHLRIDAGVFYLSLLNMLVNHLMSFDRFVIEPAWTENISIYLRKRYVGFGHGLILQIC